MLDPGVNDGDHLPGLLHATDLVLILDRHRHGLIILPDLRCLTSNPAADCGNYRLSDVIYWTVTIHPLHESLLFIPIDQRSRLQLIEIKPLGNSVRCVICALNDLPAADVA